MSNMVVRTNIFALNAHRNMKNVGLEQGRASNRLSSGFRINSAADDAAGLAISETMRAQIRGLDQASRNAQDGQAMILTTEGGLEEIGNMLQRVRELLVQASNDTNTQDQRNMIEQEINQLSQEIGSMQQRVEFNTNRVLAMGPAMSSDINNAVAEIEADGIRVSDAFNMIDANRRAVAEAREMLATLDGSMRFGALNSRQQDMISRALAAVELSTVTGGTTTEAATKNIPATIVGVAQDGTAVKSDLHSDANAALATLNDLINAHGAAMYAVGNKSGLLAGVGVTGLLPNEAGGGLDTAQRTALTALQAWDATTAANKDITEWPAGAGIRADLEAALAHGNSGIAEPYRNAIIRRMAAIDELIAVNNRIDDNGFDDIEDVTDVAGDIAGYLAAYEAAHSALEQYVDTADGTTTYVGSEAYYLLRAAIADAASDLRAELADLPDEIERGIAGGSTLTFIQGLLNDRDTDLADATRDLNVVRAEMLTAAEEQFDEIHKFANYHTSGDFVAWFQVGANANQGIQFDFETVSRTVSAAAQLVNVASILVANPTTGGGIGRGIEVSPIINQIQASLDDVNRIRANLGAVQNRMDYTMRSLDISSENLSDSESRVRNADVAREMMRFTMANVLQQAAVSMLAQANQLPNNLLQLLR